MNVQTKTAFVVVEIGWEYNDEYYYRGECGGGNPRKIFLSKDSADFECEKLNEKEKSSKYADRAYTCEEDANGDPAVIETYFEVVEVEIA